MFGLMALLAFAGGIAALLALLALLAWMYRRLSARNGTPVALAATLAAGAVLYLAPSYRELADIATIRRICPSPNAVVARPVAGVNALRISGNMAHQYDYDREYRYLERIDDRGERWQIDRQAKGRCASSYCPADELLSRYEMRIDESDAGENLRAYDLAITELEGGRVLATRRWFERKTGRDFPWNAAFVPWSLWTFLYDAPRRCLGGVDIPTFAHSVLGPSRL